MSKRKNGTSRAAAALGINPYGWGNGGKKRRTALKAETPEAATSRESR